MITIIHGKSRLGFTSAAHYPKGEYDRTGYVLGQAKPNHPVPALRSLYIKETWLDRARYSVWLWSHSKQDTENCIRYHAMMDNRE